MAIKLTRLPLRKQDAVYWPPASIDAFNRKSFGTGTPIKVRWEDSTKRYIDKDGEEKTSDAVVYPNQLCITGGVLWLGLSTAHPDLTKPIENGAKEIQRFDDMPDFKGTKHLLTAYL